MPLGPAFIVITVISLILPRQIYAYIDPGSGSCIFQVVIGILLAGLFSVKVFFNQIKTFFSELFCRKKNNRVLRNK